MKKIEPSPIEEATKEIRYIELNGMFTIGVRQALSVLIALEKLEQDQESDNQGYTIMINDSEAMRLTLLSMCRELLMYIPADLPLEAVARISAIRKYVGA